MPMENLYVTTHLSSEIDEMFYDKEKAVRWKQVIKSPKTTGNGAKCSSINLLPELDERFPNMGDDLRRKWQQLTALNAEFINKKENCLETNALVQNEKQAPPSCLSILEKYQVQKEEAVVFLERADAIRSFMDNHEGRTPTDKIGKGFGKAEQEERLMSYWLKYFRKCYRNNLTFLQNSQASINGILLSAWKYEILKILEIPVSPEEVEVYRAQ